MRPAKVHPSSIQRWFEQLCRIRVERLGLIADPANGRLRPGSLADKGAVYAFWWTGRIDLLNPPDCVRDLELKGPAGRHIVIHFDNEWLGVEAGTPVPLYVGKTGSLNKRVGQHLMLGSVRALASGIGARKAERPTTSCQLRAGVDQLFPNVSDTRKLVLENVGLSYVELDDDQHAANRFYLEDLAVGLMRPILNVDVER